MRPAGTFLDIKLSNSRAVDESIGESGDDGVAYIIGKDNEGIISGFCDTTGDTNMQLIC